MNDTTTKETVKQQVIDCEMKIQTLIKQLSKDTGLHVFGVSLDNGAVKLYLKS